MNITLKQPVKDPPIITNRFGDMGIDYSRFGLRGHNGIDYAGSLGDPILAMANGRVEKIGYEQTGWGHHIILRHNGFRTLYAHLKSTIVYRGDLVSAEQQIAEMGFSGFVVPSDERGTHLHIGLIFDDANKNNGYAGYTDPLKYMDTAGTNTEHINPDNRIVDPDNRICIFKIVSETNPNIRLTPNGKILSADLPKGTTLLSMGEKEKAGGLIWRKVFIPLWIAQSDWDGTPILQDVKKT